MNEHPSKRWKYIEAVFVAPGVPHHQWRTPIGKQLLRERSSTPRFIHALRAISSRQWEDRSVHGTYAWNLDHWELLTESWCEGSALHCPETLPGDVDVIDTDRQLFEPLQSAFRLNDAGHPRMQCGASLCIRNDGIMEFCTCGQGGGNTDWELSPEQVDALREALVGRRHFCGATLPNGAKCIRQGHHSGRHCDESGEVWP